VRRRLAPVLVCLLGLFSPARVQAQKPDLVDLEWTAPPECPRLVEVQARMRKLAGSLKASATPLRAEAVITRKDEGGLHLRLLIHAGNLVGERNIDGKSCKDLASATAVNLVLLLNSATPLSQNDLAWHTAPSAEAAHDDTARDEASQDKSASSEPAAPTSAAPETAISPPKPAAVAAAAQPTPARDASPESSSPRRWHVLVQLPLFAFGIGPLRAPSAGLAGAGGASFERWRLLAKGVVWFSQHPSLSSDFQPYGGDIDHLTGTLQACRALALSLLEIAPCAVLSWEHVSARGSGAHIAARTAASNWLGVGLGVQARFYVMPWLSLNASVEGELETSSPQLSIGGVGAIEQLLPVAATGTVGPEWIF
jgi:hypothetical protein